jgi:molecular chaperone GrpE (heat shock protein)
MEEARHVPDAARSPESYEREIRSLSKALSDECANSLRLAQEAQEFRERVEKAREALKSGDEMALLRYLRGDDGHA